MNFISGVKMRPYFFSVSLEDNIPTLLYSIPLINKFYCNPLFFIICPDTSVTKFIDAFVTFKTVKIIPESSLITLKYFKYLISLQAKSLKVNEYSKERLGWYYQQTLKISFLLKNKNLNAPCVMWDADSIPLKKIIFFSKNKSILYGSRLEFHSPYFATMKKIFNDFPSKFMAFTVQFFTCTPSELIFLNNQLDQYHPKKNYRNIPEWIACIIIDSVLTTHKSFDGSLFSEQELVGLSNMLYSHRTQRSIRYLRWGFNGILSEYQMRFAKMLGFQHITYENISTFANKKQDWLSFSMFLLKETYRQRVKKSPASNFFERQY